MKKDRKERIEEKNSILKFQSCGRTMERKSLLVHVKASFDPPSYLVKK